MKEQELLAILATVVGAVLLAIAVILSGGEVVVQGEFVLPVVLVQSNILPVAEFIFSSDTNADDGVVRFSGISYDPDGYIVDSTWSLGDGTRGVKGDRIGHTYAVSGVYTVTLTVTDNMGATDSKSKQVGAFVNRGPHAQFTGTVSRCTGAYALLELDASSSWDDGYIVGYRWFQNGEELPRSGAQKSIWVTCRSTYNIVLIVTDNNGRQDDTRRLIYAP